eukprot:SAG31_NODE_7880_length_1575_cov_1.536585_3_plen_118_part_00
MAFHSYDIITARAQSLPALCVKDVASLEALEAANSQGGTRSEEVALLVATICSNIAVVLGRQQRNGEATRMIQRSLQIRQQVLGADHLDTATAHCCAGQLVLQAASTVVAGASMLHL